MNEYIKCTPDYCYFVDIQDCPFDSIDELLRWKFGNGGSCYKHDLILSVYTKHDVKASECNAFDVGESLLKSDCKLDKEFSLIGSMTFWEMSEEDRQELKSLINNFLDGCIETGVFIADDFVGYIVLTKDILNDGKPIDGREFLIHKTDPSIV